MKLGLRQILSLSFLVVLWAFEDDIQRFKKHPIKTTAKCVGIILAILIVGAFIGAFAVGL